jgi:Protein of unknown function (DUF433)
MFASVTYPHLLVRDHEPTCLERLPRIRVAQVVMDYLAYGWSVDEICQQHPHLRLAEAHAAMTYYFDHTAEIEAEIQSELQELAQQRSQANPSRFLAKMRAAGRV